MHDQRCEAYRQVGLFMNPSAGVNPFFIDIRQSTTTNSFFLGVRERVQSE
jgi:hypothetical protein